MSLSRNGSTLKHHTILTQVSSTASTVLCSFTVRLAAARCTTHRCAQRRLNLRAQSVCVAGDLAGEEMQIIALSKGERVDGRSSPKATHLSSSQSLRSTARRSFDPLKSANTELQIKQSQEKGIHMAGLFEMVVRDPKFLDRSARRFPCQ